MDRHRWRLGPLRAISVACVALFIGACTVASGLLDSSGVPTASASPSSLGTPEPGSPVPNPSADEAPGSAYPASLPPTARPTTPYQTPVASLRGAPLAGIAGHLTAGPTCPVETVPPKPTCAPRPVSGATVVATDGAGKVAARAVSDGDGYFRLAVAPGTYTVTAEPVPGLLRAPAPKQVTVPPAGGSDPMVDLQYDTGMR